MALDFPFARSLVVVRSETTEKKPGEVSKDTRYFVSSAEPRERTPAQWQALVRGHWGGVEIRNHWRRDALWGEDDSRTRYGSNHTVGEFDLYYQEVQKRIKDQQWPNADHPHAQKIDVTIVVDMLLTGFDSKCLHTLYVDKNLKHHGLIQAFSRTNRVLNGTKPYGNILDFRQQQDAVDAAIALFSGEKTGQQAREIWFVDKAPVVIEKLQGAVQKLDAFMKSQGLDCAPEAVPNLKGDAARGVFINLFKEVQRLKTQLDQSTDLSDDNAATIEQILPNSNLLGFRGA